MYPFVDDELLLCHARAPARVVSPVRVHAIFDAGSASCSLPLRDFRAILTEHHCVLSFDNGRRKDR